MTAPKRPFAQNTKIGQERTVADIRTLLRKRGIEDFLNMDRAGMAVIGFKLRGRNYRFDLLMPAIEDYRLMPNGQKRGDQAMIAAWQGECDRRFRALFATIKGRMIAVDEGIATFEEEFAMETVIANGQTVRDYLLPQIEATYASGKMPPMLPQPKD